MSTFARVPLPAGDVAARLEAIPTGFICDGCGYVAPRTAAIAQRCPSSQPGDDIDHVLRRVIDTDRVRFPRTSAGEPVSPFETYRQLCHSYHVARALGWSDADYVALVRDLDENVAAIEAHGFRPTPLREAPTLAERLGMTGALFVKDETANVAGSHKARHLMGTALELELAAALRRSPIASVRPTRNRKLRQRCARRRGGSRGVGPDVAGVRPT